MEGFKWHQPPAQPQPHETTTATALVSLTPVAPVSQVRIMSYPNLGKPN